MAMVIGNPHSPLSQMREQKATLTYYISEAKSLQRIRKTIQV